MCNIARSRSNIPSLVVLASVSVIASGFLQPLIIIRNRAYLSTIIATDSPKSASPLFQFSVDRENGDDEALFRSIIEKKEEENVPYTKQGAGVPRDSLGPEEVAPLIMMALQHNNFPEIDAGLVSVWEFSSDTTKFVFKNNRTGE